MSRFRQSVVWMLVLPIPAAIIVAVIAVAVLVPRTIENNVRLGVIQDATQTVQQFKTLRGYYTANVIKKVVATEGLSPGINHNNDPGMVPLPATMIHDLSKILAEQGMTINLFSKFPFPNRADRELDSFQNDAWDTLVADSDQSFVRQEDSSGSSFLKVAVADKMVADACVNCHNSHPDSPKLDWKLGDVRGVLAVSRDIGPQLAEGAKLSTALVVGAILLGIILTAIALTTARAVARPLARASDAVRGFADGNYGVDLSELNRDDEIGEIAKALNVFREKAQDNERLQEEKSVRDQQEIQKADRRRELAERFQTDALELLKSAAGAAQSMTGSVSNMVSQTTQAKHTTDTVAASNQAATTNVQTVASAAEELSASIEEIGRQILQSTHISSEAVSQAEESNVKVEQLSAGAQKIGEFTVMINDIAAKTNLLALNATIESARAGEAGKGFAVVASEVKSLAAQTARATEEIGQQIKAMQDQTQSAVEAIGSISETIQNMNQINTTIASAVEEQSAATQEIARSVQEAAGSTSDASAHLIEVQTAIESVSDFADTLNKEADEVAGSSEKVRDQVSGFLKEMLAS